MAPLLAYEVTAKSSDDLYFSAIVFAFEERHAYALGAIHLWYDIECEPEYIDSIEICRLEGLDAYGQQHYGKEKVIKFESWALKEEEPELSDKLRDLGFYFEGDSICASCSLYTMDGEYPICDECECCDECGHDDGCESKGEGR